ARFRPVGNVRDPVVEVGGSAKRHGDTAYSQVTASLHFGQRLATLHGYVVLSANAGRHRPRCGKVSGAFDTAHTIRAPRFQCQDFNSPHQARISSARRAFSPVIMRKIVSRGVSVDESRGFSDHALASPRHAVRFPRLWIAVDMWISC